MHRSFFSLFFFRFFVSPLLKRILHSKLSKLHATTLQCKTGKNPIDIARNLQRFYEFRDIRNLITDLCHFITRRNNQNTRNSKNNNIKYT